MKKTALLTLALLSLSTSAFAWPGTRSVRCKSLPGAKKKVSLLVSMTGSPTPDMPAEVDLAINDMSVKLDDPERTAISLVTHPEARVVTATFDERDQNHETSLQVWAKPATVKGGLNKETCREYYKFRAGFDGYLGVFAERPEDSKSENDNFDTLDCEYNSSAGSAGC